MSKQNILRDKSMAFAIRIVNVYKSLVNNKNEYVMSKQLLRAGTSIGANVAESISAMTKRDFVAKIYISLKECSETLYWLELLYKTNFLTESEYKNLYTDCNELKRIMTATTKTISEHLN